MPGDGRRSGPPHRSQRSLPSLIRFLVWIGILGGLGYGAMVALVTYVEPEQREMSQTVPASKFTK